MDSVSVFNGGQFTNLYSIQFYPHYIDNLPVLYCADSGGEFTLSSYTLEESTDSKGKQKSLEIKTFKKNIANYHQDVTWTLLSDGDGLWSIDDAWNLKNLTLTKK